MYFKYLRTFPWSVISVSCMLLLISLDFLSSIHGGAFYEDVSDLLLYTSPVIVLNIKVWTKFSL